VSLHVDTAAQEVLSRARDARANGSGKVKKRHTLCVAMRWVRCAAAINSSGVGAFVPHSGARRAVSKVPYQGALKTGGGRKPLSRRRPPPRPHHTAAGGVLPAPLLGEACVPSPAAVLAAVPAAAHAGRRRPPGGSRPSSADNVQGGRPSITQATPSVPN